jgi:SAM-dependent methyltransferase
VARNSGYDVEGIEVNPERFAYCRDVGLKVYENDIDSNFPLLSSYDVISLINVFSHLRSPTATFSAIHRILRDNGVILVATSELGEKAYKDEVENWHIPDHLHFAGPNTFQSIASKLNLKISYATRSLTQKVVLSEKLSYRSNRTLVQLTKTILQHIPALVYFTAKIICIRRAYLYPRKEVVVLFHK